MKRLIVGLGNPGASYEKTRHNVGFRALDALASKRGWGFRSMPSCLAKGTRGSSETGELILVKPQTFMNASGDSVRACIAKWSLLPSQLIVVTDDVALPLGELRLKPKGSAGGHRGLESIADALQTLHYPRLKMGVGAPPLGSVLADYVLSPFTSQEEKSVEQMIKKAVFILEEWEEKGVEAAMKLANTKSELEGEENV